MTTTVPAESVEIVDETPVRRNSKKREFAATATAGAVALILGLAASGLIDKLKADGFVAAMQKQYGVK